MKSDTNPHEIIVSGIHVDLTPALKTYVVDKMQRLFTHEDQIVRIRVEIEFDDRKAKEDRFTAKAHVQIHGPDANISVTSDDAYKSIDLLVDKLDRKILRRASEHKEKRNHPHEVELSNTLPKAT
jgi:putative sigma-54 modulation protein